MEIKAIKAGLTEIQKAQMDRIIAEEVARLESEHKAKLDKADATIKSLGRKWIMQAAAVDLQRNKLRSAEIEQKLQSEAAKFRGVRYGKL